MNPDFKNQLKCLKGLIQTVLLNTGTGTNHHDLQLSGKLFSLYNSFVLCLNIQLLNLGDLVIQNISIVLSEKCSNSVTFQNLKINSKTFARKLSNYKELKYWYSLFQSQLETLFFKIDTEINQMNINQVMTETKPRAKTSPKNRKTPKANKCLHLFTPLIDKSQKLKCTVKGCTITFSRRTSYLKHMDQGNFQNKTQTYEYLDLKLKFHFIS